MTELIGHVENPSAKIQFVQITQTAPGCCATCGSGQDKYGFVDTGLDAEFWGRVYFCSNCALEIAAVFGFISPGDYADLEAELDYGKLELEKMTEKADNFERILSGLDGLRALIPGSFIDSNLPSNEVPKQETESVDESKPDDVESNDGDDKQIIGQSGTSGKSSSKPRLLNL